MRFFWLLSFFLMTLAGILIVAIVKFLRTPPEERYKLALSRRDDRLLQAQLATGDAVEIAPQPRRAILRAIPWALLMTPYLAFGIYLKTHADIQCGELFGLPVSYLGLLVIFYGIPLFLLIVAFFGLLPFGLKVLKHGYLPPLDSAMLTRTVARRGAIPRFQAAIVLLLPLAAIPFLIYSHQGFVKFSDGLSQTEVIQSIRDQCAREAPR